MDFRLTEGAIRKISTDVAVEEPILQVVDLRKIISQRGGDGGGSSSERYRLGMSDGSHTEQGMLATQQNHLVHQGLLQTGSVVRLNNFTCTVVQSRRIIIIVSLDVLVDKCDIIGQPIKLSNVQSPAAIPVNSQSLNSSARVTEAAPEQPRLDQPYGGAYSSSAEPPRVDHPYGGSYGSEPGSYAAMSAVSNHPRPGSGFDFSGSAPVSGTYAGQNTSLRSPRSQVPTPVQSSYAHPPQLTYQSPRSNYQQAPPNSYARPPQPTPQQPPALYSNKGPVAKNEAPCRIVQIGALSQYSNRWTIKARVTAKSGLRSFQNARGEGKVFSFDLTDSGGEIRASCFNSVAEEFYSLIVVGKVYFISKGNVKPAQRKFNHLNHEYEIQLDTTSTIQQCFEDDGSIPQQRFNFRPISDVEGLEANTIVDIIGVVSSISPAASIRTKNGETQKRTLQLKDMSCRCVEVTLWANLCDVEGQKLQRMCDSGLFPVLAVKAGRVNDFNGKVVGTTAASQLFIELNDPQADEVRSWFGREGINSPCVSISRDTSSVGRNDVRKTISQIKDEKLGTSEKPDWITVSASVSHIKSDNCFYAACPLRIGDRQCNKKVINDGDGTWRCDRCERSVELVDYRYVLNLQIQDYTGVAWVTAFQETGEDIMGISAKDFHHLKHEMQDDDKVAEIIRRVSFTEFIFKLKVKEETFSDEQRVKSTVVKADRVSFSSKSRFYLDLMDKFTNGEIAIPCAGMMNTGVVSSTVRQHTHAQNVSYSTKATDASRVFGAPANQVGHVGSQYVSPRVPSTGSAGSYISCNICGGTSHNSLNCPNVMKVPGQSSGGGYTSSRLVSNNSGECYKCHQPGHFAKDCPASNHIPAYGSSGVQPGRYGVSNQRISY